MIRINGKNLPNLDWWYTNLNRFTYKESGSTNSMIVGSNMHQKSGSTDDNGNFEFDLYPTDYQIHFGRRNKETIYYKDLSSGSDYQTIDFGDMHTYLDKEKWRF